ncbi:hypothetical protein [Eisenbergiella tayi]|nr:hypothetical protein [Eisenbergiella tayi]
MIKLGAGSREPGAGSREPGAGSREFRERLRKGKESRYGKGISVPEGV